MDKAFILKEYQSLRVFFSPLFLEPCQNSGDEKISCFFVSFQSSYAINKTSGVLLPGMY